MKTIALYSADEIMAQVKEHLGHLIESGELTMEAVSKEGQTPWVWLKCTKKLAANTPENRALKAIGFRWSMKRGQWYHTCEDSRAWFPHYSGKRKYHSASNTAATTAVAPSSADEFEKLFGYRP